jgi:hypothetical protein
MVSFKQRQTASRTSFNISPVARNWKIAEWQDDILTLIPFRHTPWLSLGLCGERTASHRFLWSWFKWDFASFQHNFTPFRNTAAINLKCFIFSVQNFKPLHNGALKSLPCRAFICWRYLQEWNESERDPGNQWIGSWVGPRTSLENSGRQKPLAPAGTQSTAPFSSSP